MRALVTGASGFIGRRLCRALWDRDVPFTGLLRSPVEAPWGESVRSIGDLSDVQWQQHLDGIDTIFHLAAHVHVEPGSNRDAWDIFERVNVLATRDLAEAASTAGVRRMIFLSSIAAEGAEGGTNYGRSKFEAEQVLRSSGVDVTIIRPPMVYGPDSPGRFGQLARAIKRGLPLPLGLIHARRSLIFVDNLIDAMLQCAASPKVANVTYTVTEKPVAVSVLVREIAEVLSVKPRLLPVPPAFLRAAFALTGRRHLSKSLLEDCVVDGGRIERDLDWVPPVQRREALEMTLRGAVPAGRRAS